MPRKRKKGLDAWPCETDMFQDIKVRKLIRYQGTKAVAVYTCLLCNIYRDGYYIVWDSELPFVISETLGCDEGFVREVIECCVKIGLLDENMYKTHQVLTSRGIQARYQRAQSKGRRGALVGEYTLLDSPYLNDMLTSPLWVNQMMRKHNLSREEFETALHAWSKQCAAAELYHRSSGIAKQHFDQWQAGEVEVKLPEDEQWYDDSQLITEMFGQRTMLMETFCRDNNLSLEQCAQLARGILNEWQITGEHHNNLTDARKHMLNTIRQRTAGQGSATRSREQWRQQLQGEAMRLANKVYNPSTT